MAKRNNQDLSRHLSRVARCKKCSKIFAVQRDFNQFDIKEVKLSCDSYFCSDCANKKKHKLIRRVKKSLEYKDLRFLTLTLNQKKYTKDEAYETICHSFNLFIKYLKDNNYKFNYFKVLEFTKTGYPHLHILLDCFIPVALIRKIWYSITKSYIVFITRLKKHNEVIIYILKYLSKASDFENNKLFYLNRLRRYSYSRNFFLKIIKKKRMIDLNIFCEAGDDYREAVFKSIINIFHLEEEPLLQFF